MSAGSSNTGDVISGFPLPPAVTQQSGNSGADRGALPAPPFYMGPLAASSPAPSAALELAAPSEESQLDGLSWEAMSDEGVVEPMFEEPVAATTEEILAAALQRTAEEFPVDAFMIPEGTRRVPTGLDQAQVDLVKHHTEHPNHDPAHDLADRFEKLSRRLRAESIDSLLPSLTRGDRFDTLLAGFLAGYFSARDA